MPWPTPCPSASIAGLRLGRVLLLLTHPGSTINVQPPHPILLLSILSPTTMANNSFCSTLKPGSRRIATSSRSFLGPTKRGFRLSCAIPNADSGYCYSKVCHSRRGLCRSRCIFPRSSCWHCSTGRRLFTWTALFCSIHWRAPWGT